MFLARAIAASRRRIFDPLSLSPALWLSDTGTNTAQWDDISGNGRHATQSNSSFRPSIVTNALNGRQVRRFDGTNDALDSADWYAQDITAVIVGKTTSITTEQYFVSKFNSANGNREHLFGLTATNRSRILKNSSGTLGADNQFFDSSASVGTDFRVLSFLKNGTAALLSINGAVENGSFATSAVFDGIAAWRIGGTENGSNFLNGDIAEILVFPTALSTADRQKVEQYLAFKYGIIEAMSAQQVADFYENRIVAAGSSISGNNKLAVKNFVQGCMDDGIWSAIKASCLLAGPDTLAGALVPLVGPAPTNFNFVAGDYNRVTGLVGNGSSKYLNSNRNNNADPQDNNHMAAYHLATAQTNVDSILIGLPTVLSDGNNLLASLLTRSRSSVSDLNFSNASGFSGMSRNSSSDYLRRNGGASFTISSISQAPQSFTTSVFRSGAGYSLHRVSYYSIGESLDLAALDARITTYMASIS
jgi:hypothetical protein